MNKLKPHVMRIRVLWVDLVCQRDNKSIKYKTITVTNNEHNTLFQGKADVFFISLTAFQFGRFYSHTKRTHAGPPHPF